ncbi:hypothetical protein V4F39_19800 [Aquincola sp. MAHUQ-54]|uniref:Uncharacterized protein n=1 Tax=Aquincola agrisoli TaxID=3119538 RepID=A0AAW9QKN5_9BURK
MTITAWGIDWAQGAHVHRWSGLLFDYTIRFSAGAVIDWQAAIRHDGKPCGTLKGTVAGLSLQGEDLVRYLAQAYVEPAIDRGAPFSRRPF